MSDSPQGMNSLDCWDYTIELECLQGNQDLQLAAELGKTLLERNKELENSLKQQQNIIEDQTQEIEYLTKQTVALREVNDSRLRIYEQLEVNIQDLERANHRLAVDNSADKKHIKSLTANIEALELKCEQLQSNIDDLTLQLELARRKSQRVSTPVKESFVGGGYTRLKRGENLQRQLDEADNRPVSPDTSCTHTKYDGCVSTTRKSDRCQETQTTPKREEPDSTEPDTREMEQIAYLMSQLREVHTQCAKDQRKITELEEHLETMQEQTKVLERQLSQYHMKEDEMKSVQDEISSLEEVRQGHLCSRCLRTLNGDDMSLSACEDDDSSMFETMTERSQLRSSFTMEVQEYNKTSTPTKQGNNLYKDLVQKYEALLEVHRNPTRNQKQVNNCLSLHEELRMSNEFNNLNTKDTDEESGHGDSLKTEKQTKKDRKTFSRTPTDFSEAETSSSGFSDETSNKATQTDGRPGSFLCTIADGKDRISIYDDAASPIESRFRNRPEYRELFKEIFGVLKKAAISKQENEDLPLLDDNTPEKNAPQVPPVTPCNETFPDFPDNVTDDTQSILSSTMSQSSSQLEVTISESGQLAQTQNEMPPPVTEHKANAPETRETKTKEVSLTPLVRQPLEYVSVAVNVRKRSSSRRKKSYNERSDSPVTHIVGSPKVTYSNRHNGGRRRRENRPADVWVGNTKIFYNRAMHSPTPNNQDRNDGYKYEHALEYKPSPASQELHRLKTLDRTYADVLRKSDKPTHWRQRQN